MSPRAILTVLALAGIISAGALVSNIGNLNINKILQGVDYESEEELEKAVGAREEISDSIARGEDITSTSSPMKKTETDPSFEDQQDSTSSLSQGESSEEPEEDTEDSVNLSERSETYNILSQGKPLITRFQIDPFSPDKGENQEIYVTVVKSSSEESIDDVQVFMEMNDRDVEVDLSRLTSTQEGEIWKGQWSPFQSYNRAYGARIVAVEGESSSEVVLSFPKGGNY